MFRCRDEFTKQLHDFGYVPLRFPSGKLQPYAILDSGSRSGASWLGNLGDVVAKDKLPAVSTHAAPGLNSVASGALGLTVGISFLEPFLKAMGCQPFGASAELSAVWKMHVRIEDVCERYVSPLAVDEFLQTAGCTDINFTGGLMRYASQSALLVTSVLCAKKICIRFYDSNQQMLDVNTSICEVDETKVKVTHSQQNPKELLYIGANEIGFAFQSFAIAIEDGSLGLSQSGAPRKINHLADDGEPISRPFRFESDWVSIEE